VLGGVEGEGPADEGGVGAEAAPEVFGEEDRRGGLGGVGCQLAPAEERGDAEDVEERVLDPGGGDAAGVAAGLQDSAPLGEGGDVGGALGALAPEGDLVDVQEAAGEAGLGAVGLEDEDPVGLREREGPEEDRVDQAGGAGGEEGSEGEKRDQAGDGAWAGPPDPQGFGELHQAGSPPAGSGHRA
jgi:hypothetical protein